MSRRVLLGGLPGIDVRESDALGFFRTENDSMVAHIRWRYFEISSIVLIVYVHEWLLFEGQMAG